MKIELWEISKVKPYEKNAKKHPEDQVKRIAESLNKFGWDQPIVVDQNGVIIKGHGRRLAALSLNLKKVPVLVRSDLSEEQVRAARLADNRAAISDVDTELFRQELEELNLALLEGIYDAKELDFSMADLGEMVDDAFIDDVEREVAKQDAETKSKIEDLEKRRVPLFRVFGFKDVTGANEIWIARFMAEIQSKTGKTGEEALVEHAKKLLLSGK